MFAFKKGTNFEYVLHRNAHTCIQISIDNHRSTGACILNRINLIVTRSWLVPRCKGHLKLVYKDMVRNLILFISSFSFAEMLYLMTHALSYYNSNILIKTSFAHFIDVIKLLQTTSYVQSENCIINKHYTNICRSEIACTNNMLTDQVII